MLTYLMNPPFPFYFSYYHGEDENYKNILAPPFLSIIYFLFRGKESTKQWDSIGSDCFVIALYLQVQ